MLISLTDAREKLVFDEDIICGIIIETIIIFIFEIKRVYTLLSELFPLIIFRERRGYLLNFLGKELKMSFLDFFSYGLAFNRDLCQSFTAVIVVFMFTYLLAKVSNAMGVGDVIYFSFLAIFANFWGCIFIFFASFITCFFYCVVLIIMNKDLEDGLISFTPFISIGFILFLCIGR